VRRSTMMKTMFVLKMELYMARLAPIQIMGFDLAHLSQGYHDKDTKVETKKKSRC
jgi:hypothetical protein